MQIRMLLIATFVVPLSIGLALARPETCHACSCAMEPTPSAGWTTEDLTRGYDVVFRGYVVAAGPVRDLGGGATDGTYVVTMAASTIWAGPVRATYRVQAGQGGGDCTILFMPGQEWLIFAYEWENSREPLSSGTCTRTMLATDGQSDFYASILGEGTPVVDVPRLKSVGAVPVMRNSLVTLLLFAEQTALRG